MATYTTELRSLLDAGYDIWDKVRPYPIFDEAYREELNKKIEDHYMFREIGLETAAQFKHFLNSKMRLIMPYYNKMYQSERIEYDPLITMRINETFIRANEGTANNTSSNEGTSIVVDTDTRKEVYSDTPQGKLSGLDYATNLTENDDTKNQSNTIIGSGENMNVITGNENYEKVIEGNGGVTSDARLIMDHRKAFLKVDIDIIAELKDLFMNIY